MKSPVAPGILHWEDAQAEYQELLDATVLEVPMTLYEDEDSSGQSMLHWLPRIEQVTALKFGFSYDLIEINWIEGRNYFVRFSVNEPIDEI